jgi:hypothetical protein
MGYGCNNKKIMKKIQTLIIVIGFVLFSFVILFLSVRGHKGNPTPDELNTNYWKDDGPLELSPERGRFALVVSLIEDKSFSFSLPIARFTTPDLGYLNGKYVSLFAPGVSFLVIPGYVLGKTFGVSQVGTYLAISLFAVLNSVLIFRIASLLGARPVAGILGGLIFLFATPAYAYGVSLYQHHISTFLILMSLYLLMRFRSVLALAGVWFLAACSIPVDYPNLFLMTPIALFSLGRVFQWKASEQTQIFTLKAGGFLTFIFGLLPVLFFLWFNVQSYGNPFQLSGTLPSVKAIDEAGNPTLPDDSGTESNEAFFTDPAQQNKSALAFFKTRNMIRGFFVHLIGPDRGIIFYAPVILIGLFALPFLYKKYPSMLQVIFGIIGINLLLYSMWGDPWGGWAFGSRYLIPSYALLSICIGLVLTLWSRNVFLVGVVFILFAYSTGVNTLGAITTSRNPPQIEILGLEKITGKEEKYTFERNWEYLKAGRTKSFAYEIFFENYITPRMYYWILASSIISVGYSLFALLQMRKGKIL